MFDTQKARVIIWLYLAYVPLRWIGYAALKVNKAAMWLSERLAPREQREALQHRRQLVTDALHRLNVYAEYERERMPSLGHHFTRDDLATLVVGLRFPERSSTESALIVDFLLEHGLNYDTFDVSQRVGQGRTPDPSHDPAVQQQSVNDSKMRIDMIATAGRQSTIFEVKERANHHAIGQLQAYVHLWQEEHPDAPPPLRAVIARRVDPDMERVFAAADPPITVYLYENAA